MRARTLAFVVAWHLLCCQESQHKNDAEAGAGCDGAARRYRSLPGSLSGIEVSIVNDQVYSLHFFSDFPVPDVEYRGKAYRDDYAIILYSFDGGRVLLKNNGGGIYIREGLDLKDSLNRGWCISEIDRNDKFVHWSSIERFLASHAGPAGSGDARAHEKGAEME